jgi:type IV pilus assembly protein PilB
MLKVPAPAGPAADMTHNPLFLTGHLGATSGTEAAAAATPPPRPRLGELLIRKGFIDEAQLAQALGEAQTTGELLGVVLLRTRMIFEDELARTLSEQLSVPYINIAHLGVDAAVVRLMPPEVGMSAAAIPVRMRSDGVQVAFGDPTDPKALTAVEAHLPRISLAVAELSQIKRAWQKFAAR